jgi:DNA-binding response OmpR family regulator
MRQKTILIVDDEPTVREVVRRYLERDGYQVVDIPTSQRALEYLTGNRPDLIVLDVMLPGMDGLSMMRILRDPAGYARLSVDAQTPIILLTARSEERQRIDGLQLGADDYVTKPFSPQELVARVTAVLRRATPSSSVEKPIQFQGMRLDPRSRTVLIGEQSPELTAKEFDLIWFLALHPRQVFTRTQLLDHVWGADFYGDDSTVTVHVRRLREKIEHDPANPAFVQTVWGVGYKFEG